MFELSILKSSFELVYFTIYSIMYFSTTVICEITLLLIKFEITLLLIKIEITLLLIKIHYFNFIVIGNLHLLLE